MNNILIPSLLALSTLFAASVHAQARITVTDGAAGVVIEGGSVIVKTPSQAPTTQPVAKPAAPRNTGTAGQVFVNADLSGRNFAGATLAGSKFTNVNLSRTNFAGADLRGAQFVNVDMEEADLRNANFQGATMVNVNTEGALFDGTIWTNGKRCSGAC